MDALEDLLGYDEIEIMKYLMEYEWENIRKLFEDPKLALATLLEAQEICMQETYRSILNGGLDVRSELYARLLTLHEKYVNAR